jgi:hypothetical protein
MNCPKFPLKLRKCKCIFPLLPPNAKWTDFLGGSIVHSALTPNVPLIKTRQVSQFDFIGEPIFTGPYHFGKECSLQKWQRT